MDLIDWIKQYPGLSQRQLRFYSNMNESRICRSLNDLQKRKMIKRVQTDETFVYEVI